jgi:hypothetical protein
VNELINYKGLKQGKCLVVGHGEGIKNFPWEKVKDIPKILVNFYEPEYKNVIGVVCWDKDIMKEVYLKRKANYMSCMKSSDYCFTSIFYSGCEIEQKANVFLEPSTFPPSFKQPVFSGGRAIYLAQYMGFHDIYLVGFDFIPHTSSSYKAQEKEVERLTYEDTNIEKELKTQMDAFDNVKWIHDRIYQTNKESSLKKFKFKLPGELCQ